MIPRDTALVGSLVLVGVIVLAWIVRRRPPLARLSLVTAALLYVALLIVVAFFPLPIQASLIQYERTAPQAMPWTSLDPIAGVVQVLGTTPGTALRQLAGNVLLFIPFGFMAPLVLGAHATAVRVVLLALATSVVIEGMQLGVSAVLGFPYRLACVDDIILNTLGAGAGYLVFRALKPLLDPVISDYVGSVTRKRT